MSQQSRTASREAASIIALPTHAVGYLALLAAIVTGVIHLQLGNQIAGLNQQLAILFVLNGVGFLAGGAVCVSSYWREALYLVAAAYALTTIVSLFVFQGFSVDAFYMGDTLNTTAVISKAAEAVLAACAVFLYATE